MRSTGLFLVLAFAAAPLVGDESEIVVLRAEDLSHHHAVLSERLTEAAKVVREEYVTGAIGADSPLPESEARHHFLSIVHRRGYSWAESHDSIADFYIILEGEGKLLLGGEMVDAIAIEDRPGEWRAPRLDGASTYSVSKGDLVNIPSHVPHQWVLTEDGAISYVIVKVMEPGGGAK